MIEISSMFPLYITNDLGSQKAFYESTFGFAAVFFDADFYLHMAHPKNGSQLAFLVPGHASQPDFLHAAANTDGIVISFEVTDAKVAYERATSMHLSLLTPYLEEPWGQRHFLFSDPAGFMVDIVEHVVT